ALTYVSLKHVPVNTAGWGTANQSTTYKNSYAQYALDGKNYSCTHTYTQSDPWWTLDLMTTYSVNRVTITNRRDCCESRIDRAEIRVGNNCSDVSSNPICAVVSSIPAGATYSYSCRGMEGRYVTVNIPGASKILTLCEVGVYVIFPDNLATGKTAIQSTTFGSWFAEQGIDFSPGFTKSSSSCSSTTAQTNPWWRVDLRYIYRVSRVVITNRLDCCPERINGTEIRIGNSLENNGNNNSICAVISSIPAGVSSTYTCNNMEGRYVNLFLPGDSKYLTLCEVEVYGEGPLLKKTLVKMKLKSSSSLSEPEMRAQLLSQSALAKRGISDVTLQWSQPPAAQQEVMWKEDASGECVHKRILWQIEKMLILKSKYYDEYVYIANELENYIFIT
uniref:Fucolectin tachylectin-4 pentraxin-1 domain-containing protein n=1 Tax=Cyprinus carpio TaxID=7962 RepID=A0A8C1LD64_CYPCA